MWHFVHETFYSVYKETLMTWPNARDFCLQQKARLAVIETPAEEAALKKLVTFFFLFFFSFTFFFLLSSFISSAVICQLSR